MRIFEKIACKGKDLRGASPVTIAFLGDSVTQGCFEIYEKAPGVIETKFKREESYSAVLRRLLSDICPPAAVHIINAGISGDSAPGGLARIERDILAYHPDVTVVCFGLNDNGNGMAGLDNYKNALKEIFIKLQKAGSEVIAMTPNMMNTYVSPHLSHDSMKGIAAACAARQNDGTMDAYMDALRDAAKEQGIPVADVYALWKSMHEKGIDTTELLANYINHPTAKMHELFAHALLSVMLA